MTEFSRLLNKIIKNNDELKVYHIAKVINCDRTWLQKVVMGERKMNYEMVLPLCRFLKNYISESLVSELYESFAEEYFGTRHYQTILFIKDRMQEMAEKEEYIHCLAEKRDFDIERFVKRVGNNREKLIREIFGLIIQEKNRAAEQKRSSRFYVHIPVKWTAVRDLFLFTLNNEGNSEDIDFRCIFDKNEYYGNRERDYQIEVFLSACEYALYQMKVYYIGSRETSFFQAALFPYYVISKSLVLLISGNGEMFVKIDEKERVERFGKYFLELMKGERFFWEKREYGYEEMAEMGGERERYIFGNNFWEGILSESSILETEIKGKKERGYLQKEAAATTEDFYAEEKGIKIYIITSLEGLREACKNKKAVEKEFRNKEVYLLDTRKYRFHSRFYMRLMTNRIIELVDIKNKYLLGGGAEGKVRI